MVVLFGGLAPQAQAASLGKRSLSRGMSGHDVRVLQDFLTRLGLPTTIDGQYGSGTEDRVRTWEARSSVPVNGRVSKANVRLMRRQLASGVRIQLSVRPSTGGASVQESRPEPSMAGSKATIGADGEAIAPTSAPVAVKRIIAAANQIHDKPYRYGGGHASWVDSGYDCSGSLSYALRGAGLVSSPLNSSGFLTWGSAGEGEWVTVYTNPGHAYMMVAGLRFDTGGARATGTRWGTTPRSPVGGTFTARHPKGL